MTIDERAERLAQFCKEYPELWRKPALKENEKEAEIRANAEEDYQYIYRRLLKGKVSEDIRKKLKDAGVGRAFGASTEIDEVLERVGTKKDGSKIPTDLLEQYLTDCIGTKDCNNLEQYREQYINALIEGKEEIPKELKKFYVTTFDLSQPDFIYRGNNSNYLKLLKEVLNIERPIFFGEELVKMIDRGLDYVDKEKIQLRFGLENNSEKKMSIDELSGLYNVSTSKMSNIISINLSRLRRLFKEGGIKEYIEDFCILEPKEKEEFIREFFKHRDIFKSPDVEELPEETKEKLISISHRGQLVRFAKNEMIAHNKQVLRKMGFSSGGIGNMLDTMMQQSENENKRIENLNRFYNLNPDFQEIFLEKVFGNESSYLSDSQKRLLLNKKIENRKNDEIEQLLLELEQNQAKMKSGEIGPTMTIEEMDLPVRTYNCLKRTNIKTIGELTSLTVEEFLETSKLGKKTTAEVIDKIHLLGLHFKGEEEEHNEFSEEIPEQQEEPTLQDTEEKEETIPTKDQKAMQLENIIQELKQAYITLGQRDKELQVAIQERVEELERVRNEKITTEEKLHKLEKIVEENRQFFEELGELESFEEKIQNTLNELEGKRQEEKGIEETIEDLRKQQVEVQNQKEKIKKQIHDISQEL